MDDTDQYDPSEEENSATNTTDDLLSEQPSPGPSLSRGISYSPQSPKPNEENTGTHKLNLKNKRRRQSRVDESKARAKRRRQNYSDAYRILLNEVITEARSNVNLIEEEPLRPSQIGVTSWSVEEKQAFFAALDRKSKHDLQSIAGAVRTKSESEVHVYVQLLHQGTIEHHLHHRHPELVGQADLSAAFEVSQECEKALDQDAHSLSVMQYSQEAKLAKRKYGEMWLLNRETVGYLEGNITNDNVPVAEPAQLTSAVELLDLANFLKLSERVFMNSSNLQGNWKSYADNGELPSIFCTAFLDFHTLAISITKRLVQSALYFAMSRLRASDTGTYTHGRFVRKEDVTAALDVLGMKANSRDFWAEAGRRCDLHVYERITRFGKAKGKLSYSEAERRVREAILSEDESVSSSSEDEDEIDSLKEHAAASGIEISEQEESEQFSASPTDSSDLLDDIGLFPIHSARAKHQLHTSEKLARLQDTYAEVLDRQTSQKEEQRLWEILGKQQPIKPDDVELPPRPITERKLKDDLVDWRDWINYRSAWERYETPVLAESFRRNRRMGRKSRTASREGAQEYDKGATRDDEDARDAMSSQAGGSSSNEDEHKCSNDNNNDNDESSRHHNSSNLQSDSDEPEAQPDNGNPGNDPKGPRKPKNQAHQSIEPLATRTSQRTPNDLPANRSAHHSPIKSTKNCPGASDSPIEEDEDISSASTSDGNYSPPPGSPVRHSNSHDHRTEAPRSIRPFSTIAPERVMEESSDGGEEEGEGEEDPMAYLDDEIE